jgi:hypothetical protein
MFRCLTFLFSHLRHLTHGVLTSLSRQVSYEGVFVVRGIHFGHGPYLDLRGSTSGTTKPFLQRVHFAMAVAKPTPLKGLFCDGHHKTYPSDATSAIHQRKLTCIKSVPISGSFVASHQIMGITYRANWCATNPTLSILVVNLTTPTKLESVHSILAS